MFIFLRYMPTATSLGICGGFFGNGYLVLIYAIWSYPVLCHVDGVVILSNRIFSVSKISGTLLNLS